MYRCVFFVFYALFALVSWRISYITLYTKLHATLMHANFAQAPCKKLSHAKRIPNSTDNASKYSMQLCIINLYAFSIRNSQDFSISAFTSIYIKYILAYKCIKTLISMQNMHDKRFIYNRSPLNLL